MPADLHGGQVNAAPLALAVVLIFSLLSACDEGVNLAKLRRDAGPQTGCTHNPDTAQPGCLSIESNVCRSSAGDWTLVAPAQASYTSVGVSADATAFAPVAAVLDWNDPSGNVAGLLLSFPPRSGGAAVDAKALVDALAGSNAFATVTEV